MIKTAILAGEKRILGASQDFEQLMRKVYSVCKTATNSEWGNKCNNLYD